jgi:RNA polymerase sigma factor (sigma-70 family)
MKLQSPSRRGRQYVAAMVLGTALSALGTPASASAAGGVSEASVANLSRYCTACWRNSRLPVDRWGDCTQEVFGRLLGRVSPSSWDRLLVRESEERREFIRAIDTVKKRTLRDCRRFVGLTRMVEDRRDNEACARAETRAAVHQAAAELLSNRQQRILHLSLEGCSVREMARALSLTPDRVSDEKYKAIRKLRDHFRQSDTERAIG